MLDLPWWSFNLASSKELTVYARYMRKFWSFSAQPPGSQACQINHSWNLQHDRNIRGSRPWDAGAC